MDMQYNVYRGSELLLQGLCALPEVAAGQTVNAFTETARAEFRKAWPEISLSDPGVREEWVNLGLPHAGDERPDGAA